jgi:hypothetical protein
MAEAHLKHLEMIQAVIARMAQNSFVIKGWSITLVSALIAFGGEKSDPRYAILAVAAALVFWGLDAYYLQLERRFRLLYDDAASRDMGTLSLNASTYASPYFQALVSPAVVLPHSLVVGLALVVPLCLASSG